MYNITERWTLPWLYPSQPGWPLDAMLFAGAPGLDEALPEDVEAGNMAIVDDFGSKLWKITMFNETTHYKWWFSIAILSYQRRVFQCEMCEQKIFARRRTYPQSHRDTTTTLVNYRDVQHDSAVVAMDFFFKVAIIMNPSCSGNSQRAGREGVGRRLWTVHCCAGSILRPCQGENGNGWLSSLCWAFTAVPWAYLLLKIHTEYHYRYMDRLDRL